MRHELLGMKAQENDYIFDRADGSAWEPWTFSALFARLIQRAAVPKIRFHDLRHSCATLSLEAGIDLKSVSASLGHSAISTTADLYLHLGEQLQKEHAARVDAVMGGAWGAALPGPYLVKSRESHRGGPEPKRLYEIRASVVAPTGIEPFSYRKLWKLTQPASMNRPALTV